MDERAGQPGSPGPTPTVQAIAGKPGPDGKLEVVDLAAKIMSRDDALRFVLRYMETQYPTGRDVSATVIWKMRTVRHTLASSYTGRLK